MSSKKVQHESTTLRALGLADHVAINRDLKQSDKAAMRRWPTSNEHVQLRFGVQKSGVF